MSAENKYGFGLCPDAPEEDAEPMKNPHAQALGRLGGKKKSAAKTRAARANIRKRWEKKGKKSP